MLTIVNQSEIRLPDTVPTLAAKLNFSLSCGGVREVDFFYTPAQ